MSLVLVALLFAAGCPAAPAEVEVREVEAKARKLERELSDIRAENRVLEGRREALSVTAELISGRRTEPPRKQVVEKPVLNLCEQPVTLDNRESGKAEVYKRWLELPSGRRYRVRAKLEIREIAATKKFKFGAMVKEPGKSANWPTASVGAQTFAEKDLSFDFFCPEEGQALLLIGFESGKGLAVFRDVRVCELAEELL